MTDRTSTDKPLRKYEVEITIYEQGTVTVEAPSIQAALDGIRDGSLTWDEFYNRDVPRVSARSAKRASDDA